ncbi:MAG: TolC family protein [Bacteroidales bacterium]|nr:TolC family protein [Bacteroidales bacterium]MBN2761486.1 TolC family protein [Bacteroidales bacterium]
MDYLRINSIAKAIYLLLTGITILNPKLEAQTTVLHDYVQEGLGNNLALQQKIDNYSMSLQVLREAKGMFYPSLSFNARYTVARGGRVIEFPAGDMLNPVYQTLNQLTGEPFPLLENQEFMFYRPTEQETKIQLVQPIVNSQLYFNKKIQSTLTETERIDAEVYKCYLIKEIKTAYYSYLKAVRLASLIANTRILLEENIRVNESLYAHDKVTIDAVLRSQSELSKLESKQAESDKLVKISAAYFNFLLNRQQNAEIIDDSLLVIQEWLFNAEETASRAVKNREELLMLENYNKAADLNYKMVRYNKLPTLLGVAEYGIQGEDYNLDENSDYLMASVVFRWNIFSGFQNNAKIKQARIQKEMTEKRYEEVKSSIRLEATQAWYDLQASVKEIETSRKQSETMRNAFEIINKRYGQGQVSFVEYLDARNALVSADESLIINQYDYLIKMAELERVSNLYNDDATHP